MTRVQESPEPTVSGMESIIQEYRARISQALEIESNQLKERAERDSSQIIDRAREEADRVVAQARQEARVESERIITEAKEEAAEARQESARIIAELKRLATIIAESETKLQPLSETQDKEAEVNSRRATGEAVVPPVSVSEKTEPALPSVGDKQDAPIKESDDSRLFKGCLKLEIVSPFDQDQTGGVPEWLARLHGLKVISTGGYAREQVDNDVYY